MYEAILLTVSYLIVLVGGGYLGYRYGQSVELKVRRIAEYARKRYDEIRKS